MKRFDDYNLNPMIKSALARLKYEQPTEVQEKVIPAALRQNDLIVMSQTGSGKTAAFAIPVCESIEWQENKPQALVLTPTRELAAQIKGDFQNIGRFKRVKATAVYGKQPFHKQQLELKQKTHVVVGTPGRVLDHIEKGTLVLNKLRYFIIDEADEMLNMGFIEQVEAIIEKLPLKRVTFVFSATFPHDVKTLCYKYMQTPKMIEIKATGVTTNTITHSVIEVNKEEKLEVLKDIAIAENAERCVIFCRTQQRVDEVYRSLRRDHFLCNKIHGGMSQQDRFAVMDDFKRGEFRYLVATDVAARGIDVEQITHIINYDLPLEKESYVHRTGRTGRAGKSGMAISLYTLEEEEILEEIEHYIGFELDKVSSPSKEVVAKRRTAFQEKNKIRPRIKSDKEENLNKEIMKLYFNGGKKKKLRAVDFVGTIAKIQGVTADDIGIITIQEIESYVEILNGKGPLVLRAMKNTTIKGKQLKVHKAKK